jgi:HlyD family secretion protein
VSSSADRTGWAPADAGRPPAPGPGARGARRATPFARGLRIAGGALLLIALVLIARALFIADPYAGSGDPLRVKRDDLVMTVEVTGELAAVRAVEIGPPQVRDLWDYKISFLAPESAVVKKGQPIVGFDTQSLEKALEQKKAEYAEAVKQIERKEIDLALQLKALELQLAEAEAKIGKARLKTDVPDELKGRIEALDARLELDDASKEAENLRAKIEGTRESGEADLRALTSQRDRAKGRVEELSRDIEAMQVKAPQDGIVIYKTGWRDEKKKVGDSTWAGERLIELPDLSEMMANGDVFEADAGRIAVGQKVTLQLEAHPDLDIKGKVRSIGRTVRRQSWRVPIKVYKIEIALDRTDAAAMRPAMRFRGQIETARIPSLVLAPREAIFLRSTGPVAFVRRGSSYVETPVRLGRQNRELVEVIEGLAEGDLLSPADLRPPGETGTRAGPLGAAL